MLRLALDDFDGALAVIVQAAEPGLLHVCLRLSANVFACNED
jgi:hypothetical protein